MNGTPAGTDDVLLNELRQQARQLVAELAGPLRRVSLRHADAALEIEWPTAPESAPTLAGPVATVVVPDGSLDTTVGQGRTGADGQPGGAPGTQPEPDTPPEAQPERYLVSAPVVGTFYRAPEPGAAPFVQVGDEVEAGQVVGIVEAMKLMNQITAEQAGRVVEILVDDGQPVEYEQPLLALLPAGTDGT